MKTLTQIADYCETNGWTDYEVAFAAMSAETTTADKDIQTADIKAYLTLVGKRLAIEESDTVSAKTARLSFADFETYQLTQNPAYKVQLTAVLDALIADSLIDANDKTAILGMGSEEKPVWQGLKAGHVANAIEWRAGGLI